MAAERATRLAEELEASRAAEAAAQKQLAAETAAREDAVRRLAGEATAKAAALRTAATEKVLISPVNPGQQGLTRCQL